MVAQNSLPNGRLRGTTLSLTDCVNRSGLSHGTPNKKMDEGKYLFASYRCRHCVVEEQLFIIRSCVCMWVGVGGGGC